MSNTNLKEYRTKLYTDLYAGIIPDRFPVNDDISLEPMIQYAGLDLRKVQYEYTEELVTQILDKIMEVARGDSGDFINAKLSFARNATAMMFSRNTAFIMNDSGFFQHPEKSTMSPDEYDEFIENPEKFIVEKSQVRFNPAYDTSPIKAAFIYFKAATARNDQMATLGSAARKAVEKYQLFSYVPGTVGGTDPPFDILTDFNRGFTQINMDLRRRPEKVLAAIEALMPYCIYYQKTPLVDNNGPSKIMTHMGVFLNNKDFDKFYWPTFNELCHIAGERGQHIQILAEGNWERFTDQLMDLPALTRFQFELGDPKHYKDTIGKKHILGGLYPITMLRTDSKEKCIDKAKELIDIMAPGGNFYFTLDRTALSINDINPVNYRAVMEYAVNNGKYDNPGQKATDYVFEDTVINYSHKYPEFKSNYYIPWEEYKSLYPPVNEEVEPLMRAQYEKYSAMFYDINII